MKKILSVLLTAAMLISAAAIPVSADYTEAEYDIERASYDYNEDGTVNNPIDDTQAKEITATEDIFKFDGMGYLTSDFFLSYDFSFYTDKDTDTVPGEMTFGNTGTDIGPKLSYDSDGSKKNKGQLVTQTGSTAWSGLGEIAPDEWYTIEFEGKFLGAGARVDCSLYKYDGGEKTLVKKNENINLRNFSGSSNKKNICRVYANNVYVDNVKLISTHPNELNISTSTGKDELSAGGSVPLSYALTRNGKSVTNTYSVTLALYDEADTNPISEDVARITPDNILVTDLSAPAQTITVRATATVGDNELKGTKQIKINAVNTDDEKFDEVIVEGPESVKAGTEAEYTFTAKKNGTDVTDTLTDADFKWGLYTTDDLNAINNKSITITDGRTASLSVGTGVVAQKLNVRLSTQSGFVFGTKTVEITFPDSQTEDVLAYNACEDSVTTASRVQSIDGSNAYRTTANTYINFPTRSDYVATEFDICFASNESGVYFERDNNGGGKWNTSFYLRSGSIQSQTGSSSWASLGDLTATTEDWFHFEVLYSAADASCIVTKYNEDGTLGEPQKFFDITRRNADGYGCLDISGGVIIDNIKITAAAANELTLSLPREKMFAGETLQAEATAARNGLPIKNTTGLTWAVLDEEGLPIIDENALVKISDTGLLTVDAMAPAQKITVRVTSASGHTASADVNIQTSDIFEIKNIGVNEEKTKITKLYVDKKFNYNDDVTFIIAIHGEDGILKGVSIRPMYGDSMNLGSNELTLDMSLPADFDPETDDVDVMVWTTF